MLTIHQFLSLGQIIFTELKINISIGLLNDKQLAHIYMFKTQFLMVPSLHPIRPQFHVHFLKATFLHRKEITKK